MKKSIKNTIMIGMAAVLIGTSAITISYAKENRAPQFSPPSQSQQSSGNQSGNPFENFNQNGDNQQGNNFKNRQLPDNQKGSDSSGSNSNQPPQPPNNQQGESNPQQEQAPNNSDSGESSTESKDSSTNTSLSIESLAQDDAQNTAMQGFPDNNFKSKNSTVISALCYMFAALQIAIILSILAYLIISKMNRISFNEVLANMKKSDKKQIENQ